MTDTPQGRSETNEATGEIRTPAAPSAEARAPFDPDMPYATAAGWPVYDIEPIGFRGLLGLPDGSRCEFDWHHDGRTRTYHVRDEDLSLVNTPLPVSGGASTCDRSGQADAAVAEAPAYWQWKSVLNSAWSSDCISDNRPKPHPQYEERALYVSPEVALRAAVPRELEGWRAGMEAAAKAVGPAIGALLVKLAETDEYPTASQCAAHAERAIRELSAPPTAAPFKGTGEGEDDFAYQTAEEEHRQRVYDAASEFEPYDDALHAAAREELLNAPTAAAPAPGREESATTLPPEALEAWTHYEPPTLKTPFSALKDAVILRHAFMSGFLARREPTRLEGGVTETYVEAVLDSWFLARVIGLEKGDPSYEEARVHMRAALEAAASAAPSDAGGKDGRS